MDYCNGDFGSIKNKFHGGEIMKKNILLVAVLLTASFFGQSVASATPPIIGTFAAGSLKLAFIDPTQAQNGCNVYAAYDTNNKLVDFLVVYEDTERPALKEEGGAANLKGIPFNEKTTKKMISIGHTIRDVYNMYEKNSHTNYPVENGCIFSDCLDFGVNLNGNCDACVVLSNTINTFYGNN